jgi:hypothetical protein
MTLSSKSLAGPGYIILNAIRVMNIIGFLAVIAASIVMLVKTSVASKFFFFDAVTHVLTAIASSKSYEATNRRDLTNIHIVFLLASELSLFRGFFARNWPLLSPAHGFVTLALAMIVLGINMLGNLNKEAVSKESLGLAFWRVVISAGIVIFIMGWINLLAVSSTLLFGKTIADHHSRVTSFVTIARVSPPVKSAHTAPSLCTSHPHRNSHTALFLHPSQHNRTSSRPRLHQNSAILSASSDLTAASRFCRLITLAHYHLRHTVMMRLYLQAAGTRVRPIAQRRRSGRSGSTVARVLDRSSQSTSVAAVRWRYLRLWVSTRNSSTWFKDQTVRCTPVAQARVNLSAGRLMFERRGKMDRRGGIHQCACFPYFCGMISRLRCMQHSFVLLFGRGSCMCNE